jgi:hypothetical protein
MDFQAEAGQFPGDDSRCADFLESEFGVHVEISPQGLGVFEERLGFGKKVSH